MVVGQREIEGEGKMKYLIEERYKRRTEYHMIEKEE